MINGRIGISERNSIYERKENKTLRYLTKTLVWSLLFQTAPINTKHSFDMESSIVKKDGCTNILKLKTN